MFKGMGSLVSARRGKTSDILTIPIEFSTPISDREWQIIRSAIYARLSSAPVRVDVSGNCDPLEKELTVVFL